jgi:hypothetical protein
MEMRINTNGQGTEIVIDIPPIIIIHRIVAGDPDTHHFSLPCI